MSIIISKVDSINKLQFEPFPTNKQIRAARIVKVDRVVVAVDAEGTIYSTEVHKQVAYSLGCNVESTLRGCQRLGLLSKAAVDEHQALIAERNKRSQMAHAAQFIESNAKILGIKLTNAQRGRIERAKSST